MKKIFLIVLILNSISVFAQNEIDALRYSKDGIFGTAKFTSMGGSFGALGGDFSNLHFNPAGLGLYQNSEVFISPSMHLNKVKSYYTQKIESEKVDLSISNLGIIFSSPIKNKNWNRINFGIGISTLNSYDQDITIQGQNKFNSLADKILDLANGNYINELDDFYGYPGFMTYLIDTTVGVGDNGQYFLNINGSTNKTQRKIISSSGNKNELVFSFASSMNDKLYIGTTFGFPIINYNESSKYSEFDFDESQNALKSYDLKQNLSVYGQGVNLKLGIIARVNQYTNLGLSLQSPTLFNIEETFYTEIVTYTDSNRYNWNSPYNYFEYELLTPAKIIFSGSTRIKNILLINADFEVINYSYANLSSENAEFINENTSIDSLFIQSQNIRLGADVDLGKIVSEFKGVKLRTGIALNGKIYESTIDNFSSENYSFGIGTNNNFYFLDLSYILHKSKDSHNLYSEDLINPVNLVNTNHSIIFTLGFRY